MGQSDGRRPHLHWIVFATHAAVHKPAYPTHLLPNRQWRFHYCRHSHYYWLSSERNALDTGRSYTHLSHSRLRAIS